MWTSENRYAYERKAQRYPSDLTDEEWALVEPHLPPPRQRSRHKSPERRDVLDAILYVLTTGCQWQRATKGFPPEEHRARLFRRLAWRRDTDACPQCALLRSA